MVHIRVDEDYAVETVDTSSNFSWGKSKTLNIGNYSFLHDEKTMIC